jgi:hypothetical protein
MNDLGDSQVKRRDRDSEAILSDVLYLILDSHPYSMGCTHTYAYCHSHPSYTYSTQCQSANLQRIDLAQAAWVLQLWFIAALVLLAPALRRD